MRTGRAATGHGGRVVGSLRGAGRATLGWLRSGQLGADGRDIWSHPAGQWRF
jgi:hypothetical protein